MRTIYKVTDRVTGHIASPIGNNLGEAVANYIDVQQAEGLKPLRRCQVVEIVGGKPTQCLDFHFGTTERGYVLGVE